MKKALRYIIIGVICVAILCGYYYYLSHRKTKTVEDIAPKATEVEAILSKDFVSNYPSTPREVVKNYNRILCCFYNEEYTGVQLMDLANKARLLLDDELLELNPFDEYFETLTAEIDEYKMINKRILSTTISDSNDVAFRTVKGDQCAYVKSYYFCKVGTDYDRTYEEYVLRKDEHGNWKILAWRLIDADDFE